MSKNDTTVVKDGQLAIATVAQTGEFITGPSKIDATALVQTEQGPQLCVKTVNVGGGGGGSTVTVDQTYDPTSTNAQSGTAVAEAVAPALKNTATGSNALTILGTSNNKIRGMNIGASSTVTGGYSVAIGAGANSAQDGCSVGNSANASGQGATSIGGNSAASASYSISLGKSAYAEAANAIQIGAQNGVLTKNTTANTLQVYSYQLLDGTTGKIPPERLGTGYDATKTQVLKHINGVATWVDEA